MTAKTIIISAAAVLALTAGAARAQDAAFQGAHISAGVSYADSSVDQPLYNGTGRLKASETGTGYRLAAGYDWRMGDFVVGGELGTRFGAWTVKNRVGTNTVEAASGAWDYSARAGVVMGDSALIYARLGGARTRMRQSVTPTAGGSTTRSTKTADGLLYGAGVEYALGDRWALRGEYSRVEGESKSHRSDVTLSAVMRF